MNFLLENNNLNDDIIHYRKREKVSCNIDYNNTEQRIHSLKNFVH